MQILFDGPTAQRSSLQKRNRCGTVMYSVRYRTVHSQKKYGTGTFMINGTSIFAIIITYLADSTVH